MRQDYRPDILQAISFESLHFLRDEDWALHIDDVLAHLGNAAGALRAAIIKNSHSPSGELCTTSLFEWCAEHIEDHLLDPASQYVSYREQGLDRWIDILESGQTISGRRSEFPKEEQEALSLHPGDSVVVLPIFCNLIWWGQLAFDAMDTARCTNEEIAALQTAADILGTAIQRQKQNDEQRLIEASMQQTQRLESLGLLAGGIAHDFNNLLTVIMANVSRGQKLLPEGHEAATLMNRSTDAAEQAAELAEQLLTYAGEAPIELEAIDPHKLITDLSNLLKSSISPRTRLDIILPDDMPAVQGDATLLKQIVMNLIINAAEAIGKQLGRIEVTCTTHSKKPTLPGGNVIDYLKTGPCLQLKVTDTGHGIDPTAMRALFDPFFTTKPTGRGLGLAAVIGAVRSHHGAITVASRLQLGSTFSIFLPLAAQEISDTAVRNPTTGEFSATNHSILIVDDEMIIRETAYEILMDEGYAHVWTAATGVEALQLFEQHKTDLDLVILDRSLPDLDGEEVFRKMRTSDPNAAILISSGYKSAGTFSEATGFLHKPYRADKLTATVAGLLQEKG